MDKVFKIVLVGPAGSGKTSLIKRLTTGKFSEKYITTTAPEETSITFSTNMGNVTFKVWDCPRGGHFDLANKKYYCGSHGCIILLDHHTSNQKMLPKRYIEEYKSACPKSPFVMWSGKGDIDSQYNVRPVSSLTGEGVTKPFTELARCLISDDIIMGDVIKSQPKTK